MNYNFLKKLSLTIIAFSLAHVANAEITIDGSMQWHYIAKDPGTTVNGASDDYMHSDNKVNFTFTNKTDSGLTVSMFQTIRSNGTEAVGTAESDGNSFLVEGGFGTVSFGNTGGIGDSLSPTAADLIGPGSTDGKAPQFYSSTGSLTSQQASLINIIDAENNITYTLPPMGGLTLGASYKDAGQGAAENADETVIAGSYEFTSGAVNGTIVYANNSISGANAGDSNLNSTSLGFTVSSGPFTAIVARAEDDQSATVTTEVNDYGFSYAVNDALTLAAAGTEVDESVGGETLSVTSVSAKYTIVSGLDAYLTYSDYDYAAGTSGATADDGSVTILSLEATF